MIAILIELIISWLLLKYVSKQPLNVLFNLHPYRERLLSALIGFALPFIYLSFLYLGIALWVQNPYKLNPDYTFTHFLKSFSFVLKGVILEELLFRGALLYILVHKIGAVKAMLISAIAFGIYHWFSFGILGQPLQMLLILLSTGTIGYLLALAFVKTCSLVLPFALHFGYNFTSMILFSNEKNIGLQLLVKTYAQDLVKPEGIFPLLMVVIYYTGFPILGFLYLRLLNPKLS